MEDSAIIKPLREKFQIWIKYFEVITVQILS